jgi:hypothetical protein
LTRAHDKVGPVLFGSGGDATRRKCLRRRCVWTGRSDPRVGEVLRRCLGVKGGGADRCFSGWVPSPISSSMKARQVCEFVRVLSSWITEDAARAVAPAARGHRDVSRFERRETTERIPRRRRGGGAAAVAPLMGRNCAGERVARDTGGRELGKRGWGRITTGARTFSSWFSSSSMPSPVSPDAPESPLAPDSPRWAAPTIPLRDDCSALVTASRARSRHIAAPLRWCVCVWGGVTARSTRGGGWGELWTRLSCPLKLVHEQVLGSAPAPLGTNAREAGFPVVMDVLRVPYTSTHTLVPRPVHRSAPQVRTFSPCCYRSSSKELIFFFANWIRIIVDLLAKACQRMPNLRLLAFATLTVATLATCTSATVKRTSASAPALVQCACKFPYDALTRTHPAHWCLLHRPLLPPTFVPTLPHAL